MVFTHGNMTFIKGKHSHWVNAAFITSIKGASGDNCWVSVQGEDKALWVPHSAEDLLDLLGIKVLA